MVQLFFQTTLSLPRMGLFAALLCMASSGFAAEFQESEAAKLERFIQPERLTFGPEDNFQSTRAGDQIVFTEKIHLTSNLFLLDLKTREKREITGLGTGSEQAEFSPDSTKLVFRSLARNAEGEICWKEKTSSKANCLPLPEGEKQMPFWVGNQKIGYLLQSQNGTSELHIFNKQLSRDEKIETSEVPLHPSASPDGDRLVWIETKSNAILSRRTEGTTAQTCRNQLTWPGLIAFPKFAKDNRSLVATWYPADSNDDARIDIQDRGTIVRIPIEALCSTERVLPEVLTSLEHDCSQPRMSEQLDVTCAYQGSLDLYRIPKTGLIPAPWKDAELLRAHASARSAEERLFILWTLASRKSTTLDNLSERIWVQYLILRDDVAALQWMPPNRPEAELWKTLLQAGATRKQEPIGEITLSLRNQLENLLKTVTKQRPSFLRSLAEARIQRLLGTADSRRRAKETFLRLTQSTSRSFPELLLFGLEWDDWQGTTGQALPEDKYLAFLAKNAPNGVDPLPLYVRALERLEKSPQRRGLILAAMPKLPTDAPARRLLEMEVHILNVIENKPNAYLGFDKDFSKLRKPVELLRAAGYRAIRSWTQAEKLKEVQFVTSNLLRFLPSPSMEWTAARDYAIASAFDRGYALERERTPLAAYGHFYGAILYTDDVEAHWGFLRNLVAADRSGQIKAQIDELVKRGHTEALAPRLRVMGELAAQTKPLSDADLDRLLAQFEKAPAGKDHPASLLIESSLRLEKLLGQTWRETTEQQLTSRTIHRDLTIALDGAMDNARLASAVMQNMALLYTHTRQWGAAQRAWQRLEESQKTRVAELPVAARNGIAWFHATAFFHLGDPQMALKILNEHGRKSTSEPSSEIAPEWQFAWQLRRSLYATLAGDNSTALKAAELALAGAQGQSTANLRSALLLKGRALWALKRNPESRAVFMDLWGQIASEKGPSLTERPTARHPRRTRILVSGFLAQLATTPDERRKWYRQRLVELGGKPTEATSLGLPLDVFFEARLKAQLHLFDLASAEELNPLLQHLFADLTSHQEAAGTVASVAAFETLHGLLIQQLRGKQVFTPEQLSLLNDRVGQFIQSAEKVRYPSPLLTSQKLRLQSTQYAVLNKGEPRDTKLSYFQRLLASDPLKKLQNESPALGRRTQEWIAILSSGAVN